MSAKRHLNPRQFTFDKDISGGMGSVEVHHPDVGLVGQIYWNTDPSYKTLPLGAVTRLDVHADYHRQGIGTRLWNEARAYDPRVRHAPPEHRTPAGKKFVKAIGGPGA